MNRAKTPLRKRAAPLDQEGLAAGTSAATALATRAAHRLFDALMDEENGAVLADVPSEYYGVVVKALLAHRAHWGVKGPLLDQLYGPHGQGQHVPRKDNIARVLGYGRPLVEEAMTCAANRATLVGHGTVTADGSATLYRVPLPASLERVTEPRSVTLTLAWFAPVNVRHRAYRRAKLELQPLDLATSAGVSRVPEQPSASPCRAGRCFTSGTAATARWRSSMTGTCSGGCSVESRAAHWTSRSGTGWPSRSRPERAFRSTRKSASASGYSRTWRRMLRRRRLL